MIFVILKRKEVTLLTISRSCSDTRGAFWLVFGWTLLKSFSTTSENILEVCLCRLDTDIRAARIEKSGCFVAQEAAVWAASSSSSMVVTPGYTPIER